MKYCTSRGGKRSSSDVHRASAGASPRRAGPASRGSGTRAAARRRGGARAACGCTGRGRCRSTCRAGSPAASRERRVSISRAALLVKVTARMPAGETLPALDQPGDARGEHARLAAARAGEDQRVLVGQRDGGELFGVEVFEVQRQGAAIINRAAALLRANVQFLDQAPVLVEVLAVLARELLRRAAHRLQRRSCA